MKWIRKNTPIEAVQITEHMVLANLIEKQPLPAGLHVGSASYHADRRELHHASIYGNGIEEPCRPGDWVIGPDADGKYKVMSCAAFGEAYEPAHFENL